MVEIIKEANKFSKQNKIILNFNSISRYKSRLQVGKDFLHNK